MMAKVKELRDMGADREDRCTVGDEEAAANDRPVPNHSFPAWHAGSGRRRRSRERIATA